MTASSTFVPVSSRRAQIGIAATVILSALLILSAAFEFLGSSEVLQSMATLGIRAYLLRPLALAKISAVIALWVPNSPRLREWAYAGLAADLTGALYSHTSVEGLGSPTTLVLAVFLSILVASYLLRRTPITAFSPLASR